MTIWLDVEDLFEYARANARPSGIQRLSYEIYAALHALSPTQIGFVRHDRLTATLRVLDWAELEATYNRMAQSVMPHTSQSGTSDAPKSLMHSRLVQATGMRALAERLPREVVQPLGEAVRAQIQALRSTGRAAAALPSALSRRTVSTEPAAVSQGTDLRDVARPGDTLAALGSPWSFSGYPDMVVRMAETAKMRFAMLVYDLIPLVRPEYCDAGLIAFFSSFVRGCLPLADTVLAISNASVRDTLAWSAREGIQLRSVPRSIPIGTGFTQSSPAAALPQGLTASGYALFVSTLEARKNHIGAFRAWRRLLDELGPERVPTLVFAGRIGWMVADLMQQIHNSKHLDGKLVIIENPDDASLAALYRAARFTVFPSFYEGWGLPVSESLAFGKVCLASNSSSVPEAGGPFCLYHDPDNVTEAVALYRRALLEPQLIVGLEARIAAEYSPTSWTVTAQAVLRHLS